MVWITFIAVRSHTRPSLIGSRGAKRVCGGKRLIAVSSNNKRRRKETKIVYEWTPRRWLIFVVLQRYWVVNYYEIKNEFDGNGADFLRSSLFVLWRFRSRRMHALRSYLKKQTHFQFHWIHKVKPYEASHVPAAAINYFEFLTHRFFLLLSGVQRATHSTVSVFVCFALLSNSKSKRK